MPSTFTDVELIEIPKILSAPRFTTYLREVGGNNLEALELYRWNLQIASAFYIPLQICEVGIRNGVTEAISNTYGHNWPHSTVFRRSLPENRWYNQKEELIRQANKQPTSGKVVAELNFIFWQYMLTARHDIRIWNDQINNSFPYLPAGNTIQQNRLMLHDKLEIVRKLRNRIAHHEPIFRRNALDDYLSIRDLISYRCNVSTGWVDRIQTITDMIVNRK